MRFIETEKLKMGMLVGRDIIESGSGVIFSRGQALSFAMIKQLFDKGYPGIYVMDEPKDELLPGKLIKETYNAVANCDINKIIMLSDRITDILLESRDEVLDIVDMRSYDDYIPHHSLFVAIYAVKMGIVLSYDKNRLKDLCMAGLLHDLGKYKISPNLVNKKGALDNSEFAIMKKHTHLGFEVISNNTAISDEVKMAVLLHHENENGTGYPYGHSENEITEYAKILHVADVFDALTTKKPYRKEYSNANAIDYLEGGRNILFDSRCVDAFEEIIVPYPTGTSIMLSNGDMAEVLRQTADYKRPIIFNKSTKEEINLLTSEEYADEVIMDEIPEDKKKENHEKEKVATIIETNPDDVVPVPEADRQEFDIMAYLYGEKEETDEPKEKKKIMIVDDVLVSLIQTKGMLMSNYEVSTFNSGKAAVSNVNYIKPDLILMDYAMPEMDGATAVDKIREAGCNAPVIFLTGKCDKETVYACKKSGAADYIVKPVNAVYLKARIEVALFEKGGKVFE
ncbi:MAG: response regulator [Lachnospiraceae bacterium]|nr:response regulator [Lachnospiraceae bacterium]